MRLFRVCALLLVTIILSGCSSKMPEVLPGKYIDADIVLDVSFEVEDPDAFYKALAPYVYLDNSDGENYFHFMFCGASSYFAHGQYHIEDDRLILITYDGPNTFVFKIETDALVFMADESTELPIILKVPIASDGDKFVLEEE